MRTRRTIGLPDAPLTTGPEHVGARQQVMTMALTGAVISNAMWAFQYLGTEVLHPALAVSVAPFLVVMLRYGLLQAQGGGQRPEKLPIGDRVLVLVLTGVIWAGFAVAGIYLF